jgi:hypothetical protein
MELIIGLSITAALWTPIIIYCSKSKKKVGKKPKPQKRNTTYSRWSPEVDRLLEMELN